MKKKHKRIIKGISEVRDYYEASTQDRHDGHGPRQPQTNIVISFLAQNIADALFPDSKTKREEFLDELSILGDGLRVARP